MAVTLIDSYSEANQDGYACLQDNHPSDSTYYSSVAQSFQVLADKYYRLNNVKFYLRKYGSPTGIAYAVLYKHSGVFGTSSKPTGAVLATSDGIDVSTLTTSYQLITFTFTGEQRYKLKAGEYYCIAFNAPATGTINPDNNIDVGLDGTASTHDGNSAQFYLAAWDNEAIHDLCFYVYGDKIINLALDLQVLIEAKWTETDPAITSVKFCTQDYGHDADLELFDTNACYPQIAINVELEETITPVIYLTTKVVNSVALLVYLRPTRYEPVTIGLAQTTFYNIIEEIKRIIRISRYLLTGFPEIKISRWKIQTKKREEPIVFEARIELNCTSYEA